MTDSIIETVGRNESNSRRSRQGHHFVLRVREIPGTVRGLFLLFVFTLPFEATNVGFMTGVVSIPKLCGLFFFLSYLFHYGPLSKRSFPPFSPELFCFLGYAFVYSLNGFFADESLRAEVVVHCFTFVQLAMLYWVASEILRDPKIVTSVLIVYISAVSLFALGVVFQIPGFYAELAPGRGSAIGENPNAVGVNSALAILMTLGLAMYSSYKKVFLLALSLPLFAALVLSGSRGAVLAFLMGAVVYLLPYRRSKRVLTTILLISLAISTLVYFVARNVDFSERWEESYSEHDFAGREQIFPVAAEMIFERPLLGWSVDGFYELGRRFGGMWAVTGRDPHNLYLGVLLQAGVIGAIPFFIGLGLCGRSAWRARSEPLQLLPLVLLIAMLVVGMSNTHLNSKMYWLILALGTALGSGTRKFPNRVVASPLPSRAPKYNRFQV